ncbi:MAG: BspA family leucine-rich repeat surface protein [Lachnospiraceae bacterium]|nr:BspA family leucine-rich repeat surface protein [Lachnospiraceae bacterium]
MANKWIRKLGMGMSVIMTVSQLGTGMVLAAPGDEDFGDLLEEKFEGECQNEDESQNDDEAEELSSENLDVELQNTITAQGDSNLDAIPEGMEPAVPIRTNTYLERWGTKGGEELTAKIYVYDITETNATVHVVFDKEIGHSSISLCVKDESADWNNAIEYSKDIDEGEIIDNFRYIIDIQKNHKYEFYIEMLDMSYERYKHFYSGIYLINTYDHSAGEEIKQGNWYDDYKYIISNDAIVITAYKGTSTELMIPAEAVINGKKYKVEIDSLEAEEGARPTSSLIKISFGKGVAFGEDMTFQNMKCLEELDVSGVDTSKMTSMKGMFSNCFSLEKLDLSGFDTRNVTDMSNMFAACYDLKDLDVSSFDTSKVTNMGAMFLGCESLESINLNSFNTENVSGNDDLQTTYLEPIGNINDLGNINYSRLCNGGGAFNYLSDPKTIGISGMSGMFADCRNLKELHLNSFNTKNIVQMYGMFMGCANLQNIDLSSFDTGKVVDMSYMFYGCEKLKSLDLSKFDTSSVCGQEYQMRGVVKISYYTIAYTGMKCMFYGCKELEELNLSSFDTKNVLGMSGMFGNCSNLKRINLESFDTSNVKTVSGIFSGCSQLTSVDLSGWNLENTIGRGYYGYKIELSLQKGGMFTDSGIVMIKTPKNIFNHGTYGESTQEWSDEEMQKQMQILSDSTIFIDQATGKEYTYLPYGDDSKDSHTLVRIDSYGNTPTDEIPSGPAPRMITKEDGTATVYRDGKEVTDYTGLAMLGTAEAAPWVYVENGKRNATYCGFVDYDGAKFYVENGAMKTNLSGVQLDPESTKESPRFYFCSGGQVQTQHEGLAEYDGEWFYIKNGEVQIGMNAFVDYDGGKFLVAVGHIVGEYNGLAQDPQNTATGEWYYFAGGQAQIQYTGLAMYDGVWFYVVNGKLAVDYTGTVVYDGASFEVVAGMVQ